MKKLLSLIICAIAIAAFALQTPALAGDAAAGKSIFSANCAACHAGGKNVINPQKTLSKGDLSKYGMDSLDAIITQVTKGKNAMPAFGGKLKADQIENVATYVLETSEKGW
ncbi:cytochrome c6 PetJ [Roseofilum casamattae]|uniref:Cytochrome c6 n=1 Tax=Roseofilum casamattae BLCC-M143 TaxID=3022442 RepID=A0ABT7BZR8_9CYAN|nr:c-type cytochrome [Roseofilum casamattae]MDJ1184297.1 c-type cytochrome [Roseofilum casamattae BLCC-M143]